MAVAGNWRRTFLGSFAEAATTASWLHATCASAELPADVIYALDVCLEEVVTNIVRHGGTPATRVSVSLAIALGHVVIVVEDDGAPFDPTTAPRHRIEGALGNIVPGGLGMQLVHSFADRITYARTPRGNHVEVEVHVPQPSPIPSL